MSTRTVVLTGAPRSNSLRWDDSELLQAPLPPFIIRDRVGHTGLPTRWRSVTPMEGPTFKSFPEEASLFTSGVIKRYSGQSVATDDEMPSEFYEHSFAFHEGIVSSAENDTTVLDDSILTTSFGDETCGDETLNLSDLKADIKPMEDAQGRVCDLEDIPSAVYLQSIGPQAVVVDLIVAIMSIRPRRRVQTRWGREREIVELLVGDETRSGFRVSCWLPSNDGRAFPDNMLEKVLRGVRLRDIVYLRSVALTSFRGHVYGQSLRRNLTTLDILDREPVDLMDAEEILILNANIDGHPHQKKVSRVRSWIRNFVNPGFGDEDDSLVYDQRGAAPVPPDSQ